MTTTQIFLLITLAINGLLAEANCAQEQQESAPPVGTSIKIRSILVNEPVTVRDTKGTMIHNLDAKDFRIMDNGVEQKITYFDLGSDAISLVVLVETSSRIDSILPDIRKCGTLLTQAVMGPNAEAAIIGFNDSVDRLQNFTQSADVIEKVFVHLQDGTSGSKLYDAMALGVEMLSGQPKPTATEPGRRRVMVVLAEADDKGSDAKLGAVLRQAQLQNVTIWSVGLSTVHAAFMNGMKMKPGDPGWGSNNWIPLAVLAVTNIKHQVSGNSLQLAAVATGGTLFPTWKDHSIQSAIDEIGGELHSQYLLMYVPTGTDAYGYHEIKIEVDKNDLKVRSRPGYYLEGP
jgi:VWFA-related protein